ncbi:MAG: hypothetical protein ACR2P1_18855 [Pseudomonadales bacterium]
MTSDFAQILTLPCGVELPNRLAKVQFWFYAQLDILGRHGVAKPDDF